MALSVEGLTSGNGNGLPKTISPGNHTVKINNISLEDFTYIEGAKHLMINVETEPIDDFQGFMLDKENPDGGNHLGQVGKVKASQYAFANGTTKSGVKVDRDRSILIFLQNFCNALGINEWFHEQNNMHDTIEDFVNAFNKTAPYKDMFIKICVAGKEYVNNAGYTNYDMWFAKADGGKYAYGSLDSAKLLTYNENIHLKKLEVKNVEDFGNSNDLTIPAASSDFSLD
jgi:hypothetical protein